MRSQRCSKSPWKSLSPSEIRFEILPALEPRLLAVASEISAGPHADIGADHAYLLLHLLETGRCQKVIAVEKSRPAYYIAKTNLGYRGEARMGDGFACLEVGEVASVSLCGLGGSRIASILEKEPEKVPDLVVVQANRDSVFVRQWAKNSGFHLVTEQMVVGHWNYSVLTFRRRDGADPAYDGLCEDLALRFGPHLLAERHELLKANVLKEWSRFRNYPTSQEKSLYQRAIRWFGSEPT